MSNEKTETQMRAASMLLTIELALSDLYPGQVSSVGTLWERKIVLRLNDLEDLVIDFSSTEGIRVYIVRSTVGSGDSRTEQPEAEFRMPITASIHGTQNFMKDFVVITAEAMVLDVNKFVHKISEIANNTNRLRQAAANMEGATPPIPTPNSPA